MKRVLVVDDTLHLLEEVQDILEIEGFNVTTATNVIDGLQHVSKAPPDIVITDLTMPEIDGYSFIEKIRSFARYDNLPIIVLSAHAAKENIDKAIHLKADKYLKKPCSADDLVQAVKSFLGE